MSPDGRLYFACEVTSNWGLHLTVNLLKYRGVHRDNPNWETIGKTSLTKQNKTKKLKENVFEGQGTDKKIFLAINICIILD